MLHLKWRHFVCPQSELRLDIVLRSGQSFRWKVFGSEVENPCSPAGPVYVGVLQSKLLLLTQDSEKIFYHCVNNSQCNKTEALLKDYFQLSVNLSQLYKKWADSDPIFEKIAVDFPGVRILRQDPVENVFSFICSANNHISRISSMVEKLCTHYGEFLCEFNKEKYYCFPPVASLSKPQVEAKLRVLGFGYRSKYIQQSAKFIQAQGGDSWLFGLRDLKYEEAREALIELSGVGPKVADCVLLMSLDQTGSVPIDTHMLTIAKRYLPHLRNQKTVTDRVYREVGDYFRQLYGEYAGWAHSVLFSADLKHLQETVLNLSDSGLHTENTQGKKRKKKNSKQQDSENIPSSKEKKKVKKT